MTTWRPILLQTPQIVYEIMAALAPNPKKCAYANSELALSMEVSSNTWSEPRPERNVEFGRLILQLLMPVVPECAAQNHEN